MMKASKQYIDEKQLNKIIKVAYRDANIWDTMAVHFLALKSTEVKKTLEEYKETAEVLNEIKTNKCPAYIVNAASQEISGIKQSTNFSKAVFRFFILRPVISTAVIIIAAGILFTYIHRQESRYQNEQSAKVEIAEKQVKESLAILGKIFLKTENTVTGDILRKKVSPPLKEGFDVINNLFKKG